VLSSQCSGHAPLLHTEEEAKVRRRFLFHAFWTRFSGYSEVVTQAWHCLLGNVIPFTRLDWLLHNTARYLKSWSDKKIGSIRLQLEMAKELVLQLEAQGIIATLVAAMRSCAST
jgi:hypothetical protein